MRRPNRLSSWPARAPRDSAGACDRSAASVVIPSWDNSDVWAAVSAAGGYRSWRVLRCCDASAASLLGERPWTATGTCGALPIAGRTCPAEPGLAGLRQVAAVPDLCAGGACHFQAVPVQRPVRDPTAQAFPADAAAYPA